MKYKINKKLIKFHKKILYNNQLGITKTKSEYKMIHKEMANNITKNGRYILNKLNEELL